jgi:hypothetical protein
MNYKPEDVEMIREDVKALVGSENWNGSYILIYGGKQHSAAKTHCSQEELDQGLFDLFSVYIKTHTANLGQTESEASLSGLGVIMSAIKHYGKEVRVRDGE